MNHENNSDRSDLHNTRPVTLVGGAVVAALLAGVAQAQVPTATFFCTCSDMTTMHQAVVNHAQAHNWAAGTRVIAVNNDINIPLAMSYTVTRHSLDGGPPEYGATPISGAMIDATMYFNKLFGKAGAARAKYQIDINTSQPFTIPQNQVSTIIESRIQYQQPLGMNPFEWVMGEPAINEWQYYDPTVQLEFSIFTGAIWTVNFANGYSAQYQYQGAFHSIPARWLYVPYSLRLNGRLINTPPPAKPLPGYDVSSAISWYYGQTNPTTLSITLDLNYNEASGTVTVQEPCDCGASTGGEAKGDEL